MGLAHAILFCMRCSLLGIRFLPLLFCAALLLADPLYAQTISPGSYIIQRGTATWETVHPDAAAYTLVDVLGQANAASFVADGYVMQSGYRNRAQASTFTVSLDAPTIDYGTINRNQSITKTVKILVSFPELPGYTISVAQDHPLTSPSGKLIPDTTCDGQRHPCSYRYAGRWINPSAGGFGYSVTGPGTSGDFLSSQWYRPFMNAPAIDHPAPAVVRSYGTTSTAEQTILTVKLQSSTADASDQYINTIIITAVPML